MSKAMRGCAATGNENPTAVTRAINYRDGLAGTRRQAGFRRRPPAPPFTIARSAATVCFTFEVCIIFT